MDNPLAKKLLIKAGSRLLVHKAPDSFTDRLTPLPDGVQLDLEGDGPYDVVLQFVRSKAQVDAYAPAAIQRLREQGVLWMVYPKRSKGIQTDIHRDTGWDCLWQAGWSGIAMVAIDESWAALRFRPDKDIKRKPDSIFNK